MSRLGEALTGALARTEHEYTALAERNRDGENSGRYGFRCEPGLSSVKADWGQAHSFVRLLFP